MQTVVLTYLSRLLSAEDFGLLSVAMVFINLATVFSQFGVGPALVQRSGLDEIHVTTAFWLSVANGLLFFGAIFALTPLIARFFDQPELLPVLKVASLVFVISGLGVVADSLLVRQMNFKGILVVYLSSYIFGYGLVAVVLASRGWGVWALVAATLVQASMRTIGLYLLKPHSVRLRFTSRAAKDLLGYGAGFTLTSVFNYFATEGDKFVIGKTVSIGGVGIYTRAYAFMKILVDQVAAPLERVIFPLMSAYQDDKVKLQYLYLSMSALISFLAYPVGVLLAFNAREIVELVLGSGWEEVVLPFRILMLGLTFRISYKLGDTIAKATGFVYQRSKREMVYAALVISGTWLGSRHGVPGATLAVTLAIFVNYVLSITMGCRIIGLGLRAYLRSQLPGLALGAASALTCWGLRVGSLAVGLRGNGLLFTDLAIFGLLYLTLVLAAPAIIGQDIRRFLVVFGNNIGRSRLKDWVLRRYAPGVVPAATPSNLG